MLTLDFTRLPVVAGERILDLGCGAGRHAFECYRRGGQVVALDLNAEDLTGVAAMFQAMRDAGQAPAPASAVAVRANAHHLPFPDGFFDLVRPRCAPSQRAGAPNWSARN